jgi:UDP-N-acetylmuramate-alanine ligase
VISDYAHHPTEIAALDDGRFAGLGHHGRVLAVFQAHRYSAHQAALPGGFPGRALAAADELVLAPIYAASEPVVPGGRSADDLSPTSSGTCKIPGTAVGGIA